MYFERQRVTCSKQHWRPDDYAKFMAWRSVFQGMNGKVMPPKIRELISRLERAGFRDRGGKGSHRNYVHPNVPTPLTLSGKPGDDAKLYQVRAVTQAIEEAQQ